MTAAEPVPMPATAADLPEVVQLLDRTFAKLHASGIQQWSRGHYPELRLAGDIDGSHAWVWRQAGAIIAYAAIDAQQEAQWDAVPFRDRSGRHRCLHRLFVDPHRQGRGHGRSIMAWVEAHGLQQGWSSIRLDAPATNPISNQLYRRLGYDLVGSVHFGPLEAIVYERLLAGSSAVPEP